MSGTMMKVVVQRKKAPSMAERPSFEAGSGQVPPAGIKPGQSSLKSHYSNATRVGQHR